MHFPLEFIYLVLTLFSCAVAFKLRLAGISKLRSLLLNILYLSLFFHTLNYCLASFYTYALINRFYPFLLNLVYESISPIFLCHVIYSEAAVQKSVLKICSNFSGEHSCRRAISTKLLCKFIEIVLRHGCSPVNLLHIFRIPFPRNTFGWLLQYTGTHISLIKLKRK